ncbi:16038_t:CDS:1 [Funneliformis caledonium]|uniref:16038_t:CDS:1 n=1 Tax=Funneliformis caledonium TaxID=1117310 RepID=A0A9N8Z3Y0_9GLOM|nr:16038_t:CDS:1 [Funneliformis caledonium]
MKKLSGTASKIWKNFSEKIRDIYRKQYEINRDFQTNVSGFHPTFDDITAIVANDNNVIDDLDFTIYPCDNRKNCPICLKYFPAEHVVTQQLAIPENISESNPEISVPVPAEDYYMSLDCSFAGDVINQQQFTPLYYCVEENCLECLARNVSYPQQWISPNDETIPLENSHSVNPECEFSDFINYSYCDENNLI